MYVYEPILVALAAYLIGAIPFGVILAKLFKLPDPRTIGSGNIGATNMLRTGNKKIALLTLVLDAGKGVAAVLFAGHDPALQALSALLAAVGHMYSPWLNFKGGKGVATLLGATFAFSSAAGISFCLMFLIVFWVWRIVSLGSIAALIITPLAVMVWYDEVSAMIFTIASAIAIFKHKDNIKRLMKDEEPKTTFGKKTHD